MSGRSISPARAPCPARRAPARARVPPRRVRVRRPRRPPSRGAARILPPPLRHARETKRAGARAARRPPAPGATWRGMRAECREERRSSCRPLRHVGLLGSRQRGERHPRQTSRAETREYGRLISQHSRRYGRARATLGARHVRRAPRGAMHGAGDDRAEVQGRLRPLEASEADRVRAETLATRALADLLGALAARPCLAHTTCAARAHPTCAARPPPAARCPPPARPARTPRARHAHARPHERGRTRARRL